MGYDFDEANRQFNIIFNIVLTFIAIVFIAVVCFYVFAGVMIFDASSQIQEQGLKAVLERIWCGPGNHCL